MVRASPPIAAGWNTVPNVVWLAIIAALVAVVYRTTLGAPFLLDDEISILENESIRSLTPLRSVLWPRADVFTAGRPLLNFSFALNHASGGLAVRGYHLTNLAIHAAAALALFGIVRRTLLLPRLASRFGACSVAVALGAALLWSLHPVQTISVSYVSQRAESLMGLCYLATLYAFLRAAQSGSAAWRIAMLVGCGAGMLVKEVMITAPVVIFLFDVTCVSGSRKAAWQRHRALHLGLAATWLPLLAVMLASRIGARGIGYGFDYAWHQYLRIECTAVLHYLRLALLPVGLVFDYGAEVSTPSTLHLVLAAAVLVAGIIATGLALRRTSPLAFLGCWFFLILAPTSSFLPVAGQPIAENRMYLPLAAISVGLAVGMVSLLARRGGIALLAIAGGLMWLAVLRNEDFRSELRLWADTVAKRPQSSRAHCYRGIALMHAGRIDAAIPPFQSAIQLRPSYQRAHINLACAFLSLQRMPDAMRHFDIALRLNPDDPVAHSNFGTALLQAGRKEDALREYQTALRLRPGFAAARLNTGIALIHLGRTSEALATLEAIVRDNPHDRTAVEILLQLRAAGNQPPTPLAR
jgi:tetratricopeptide (TPR) repeat protein